MDLEVIRRILVEAKTTGVEQTTAQLKGLSSGYEGVTVASQKTETATESVARKFASLEARLDPTSRAAQQLAKDIKTLDAQLAQTGNVERHAQLLEVASQNAIKMSGGVAKATGAMEGFRQVAAGVSGQLVGMAAGMGPVGVFLSAIPGWGMPAAVALSAISTAIGFVVSEANRMGEKAVALNQLTQATGLTAQQFKAIKVAAAEAGVDSDGMGKAIEMLTFKLNDARDASGTLYKEMRKVDVALADQLLTSKSSAADIDLIAKAWRNATSEAQKAAIARAAFGRQGMEKGAVLGAIADAGGIANIRAINEATDAQTKSRAKLQETTKELQKETANLYATIATDAVQKAEHDWAQLQNTIAKNVFEASKLSTELTLLQRIMQAIAQSSPIVEPGSVAIDNARINAEQNLQRGKGSNLGANPADVESWNRLGDAMRGVVGPAQDAKKSLEDLQHEARAAANNEKDRIGLLGNAATAQEKANASLLNLKAAFLENAFGAQDSAKALADYGRAVAEVNRQASAAETTFQAQIQTLRARTAAEREAAAAATARAGGGGDAEANAQRAVTMEIEKQAQAHRDVMVSMRGQLAVAQAVTGAQKMAAQEAANYKALIDQGRTSQQAAAEAAMQTKIAQAEVNAEIDRQIHSMDQQTELIRASINGTTELVKQQQAYADAIAKNASPEKAAQLVAAMREQAAAQEAVTSAQKLQAEQQAAILAMQQRVNANEREHEAILQKEIADQNAIYQGASLLSQLSFDVGKPGEPGSSTASRSEGIGVNVVVGPSGLIWDVGHPSNPATAESFAPEIERLKAQGYTQARVVGSGINQYVERGPLDQAFLTGQRVNQFEVSRVQAQISGDRGGEISAVQGELAYMRTQPQTLENLNAIKSLQDALKQLTDATKDNTQAQDALSGLYSRQFGQGFYDGGAAVGELIYGLDNNTGGAIDAMQHANDNNTRNQNTLLTNLSQNQVTTTAYYGGGIVSATEGVQGAVQSGFSSLTYAVQHSTSPTTPSPTTPSPTSPGPISPYPHYEHIPGTPGFARGGSFTTAGYGGDDSNVVAFRVSPQRERVSIVPMSGGNGGGSSGTNNNINNNISINVPQGTNEFRSTAMHIADEIFNQVAVAGRRR